MARWILYRLSFWFPNCISWYTEYYFDLWYSPLKLDTFEQLICEDEEKTVNCSATQGSILVIPGTFYGIANEHVCNGSNSKIPEKCHDKKAHEEAGIL